MLGDWNFSYAMVLSVLLSVLSLAPLVLIPPLLTDLKGLEVITIGLVFVFRGCVQIVAMLLVGRLVGRGDPRWICGLGFLSYAIGCRIVSGYNLDIGLWDIYLPHLFFGIASGCTWLPVFYMIYATIEPDYRNDAATLVSLNFNVIGSAALAVLVALFSRNLQTNTAELGAHIDVTNERLLFPEFIRFDVEEVTGLASIQAEIAQQALVIAYSNMFWVMMWVALVALPLLALVPYRAPKTATASTRGKLE